MAESESLIDASRFEMLVQLSENNSGFFDELMRTFYNDATTNIDEMRNSLRENRRDDLHQWAHKMKGASSQIGASRLHHLSKRLMDISEDAPGADLAQLLDAVSACFEETMGALNKRTEDLGIGGGGAAAETKSHK